ncbi:MAG TPA: NACHT domain-containing protein [Solirubrobacteraceae bacterium]|jgi:hypothetical protein|nr:NACHT domain-containing protein [Solirubrobacteraceae bacterium]
MSAAIAQVLLGVVSDGLFTLLVAPLPSGRRAHKAIRDAIGQSLEQIKLPDGEVDEERLRALLQSAEVAALVRQIFAADALGRRDALSGSRELFGRLCLAYGVGGGGQAELPDGVSDRVFDAILATSAAALAALASTSSRRTPAAHEALESLRHNLVMDALSGVERMLELLSASPAGPPLDAIRDFAEDHRSQTVARTGLIEPPSFDVIRAVPIDELYVSPLLEQEGAKGDRPARLGIGELVARLHRTVVLGDPGGGKSTLARKLCHDIALDRRTGGLIPPGTVPVLVVLRDYGATKRARAISVRDFVEERAHTDLQLDVPEGAMEYLLRASRVVMVFDGLDELLDTSYRGEVTADIESFANLYPTTPMLVTSRRVGYAEAPLDPTRFQTVALGGFIDAQVGGYARKWFASVPGGAVRPLDAEVSDFIADSEDVSDLRSNPLMLALMCNLYRGAGYIPRNRPEVYERCAVMLFERWDRGRRIKVPLDFERHLRPALQNIAHWIYSRPDEQSGVPERVLIQQAAAFLQRKRFPDEDEARAEARRFVEFCRGRAWVFTDTGTTASGESLYGFTHRTFLEFFTAEHLVRTCRTPDALAAELLPHVARAEWEIVAQLAFQLYDDNVDGGADELLSALLEAATAADEADRVRLLEFASRSLKFLVPEPATLSRLTTRIASWMLEECDSAGDEQPIAGRHAFYALMSTHWENRATVAEALQRTVVDAARAQTVTPKALLEVGLHMDRCLPENCPEELNQFWKNAAVATAHAISATIQAAARSDANAACDAVSFALLSPAQLTPHHPPEVFFATRELRLYPGRFRPDIATLLLRAANGPATYSIELDPAIVGDYLGELGSALDATEPPWLTTHMRSRGTKYLAEGARDVLGGVTGDTAFGLIAALGAALEKSSERSPALAALDASPLPWAAQLAPLARRRFGRAELDVEEAIAQLKMSARAQVLATEWAMGDASFVRYTGSEYPSGGGGSEEEEEWEEEEMEEMEWEEDFPEETPDDILESHRADGPAIG